MKLQQLLSGLLGACLLLSPALPAAAIDSAGGQEPVGLSGYADGSIYRAPDGTEYRVLREPDSMIRQIRADMTGCYILAADMDLGGRTLQTPMFGGTAFSGTLDGNGHRITGFGMNSANNASIGLLFHSFTGSPAVRNLTVGSAESHIPFTLRGGVGSTVGGLVGAMKNADRTTKIENVTVYSDITYTDVRRKTLIIGGIIGRAGPATVRGCRFDGSVRIAGSGACTGYVTAAGGIVGRHNISDGTLTVTDCESRADIDISERAFAGSALSAAGGIIGLAEYATVIRDCRNSGSVRSSDRAGGILGGIRGAGGTEDLFTLRNCTNEGDILAARSAGGAVGAVSSLGNADTSRFEVRAVRCANTGDITVAGTGEADLTGGKTGAGGLIGTVRYGYLTVTDSYSNATVASPGRAGTKTPTASGIAGFLYLNNDAERLSRIERCYAVGELRFGDAAYVGAGLCAASGSSASRGYLLQATDCFWNYTVPVGSIGGACSMKLSDRSGGCAQKSPSEFADGTVLALLGAEFRQTPGTDPFPLLAPDTEIPEPERTNLYAGARETGYSDRDGNRIADRAWETRCGIPVTPGDRLTVALWREEQPSYGFFRTAAGDAVSPIRASDLTDIRPLTNGYLIAAVTVPERAARADITLSARLAYLGLVTRNDPFDADAWYAYHGLPPMTDGTASSLYGKRALFAGDSISFGYADTPVGGVSRAWAGRLAYRYNMDCTNASVSGATLTAKYPANRILSQLTPHLADSYDYVILEGGFNDANPNGKGQDAPVGTVTPPGTEAGFDAATFVGALEELFATVHSAFPDARIGFILTYRTEKHPAAAAVFATYVPAALAACEKWGVSCLNWFGDDTVNREVLATDTYTYLRDGVHPGSAAYDRLTPYVAAFMEAMQTKAPDTAKGTDTADPTSAGESAVPPSPGTDPESKPSEKPGTEASGGCRSGLTGELLPFAALAALLSVPGRKKYKTRKEEPTP